MPTAGAEPPETAIAVGVDVGGTKVALGLLGSVEGLSEVQTLPTDSQRPDRIVDQVADYIRETGSAGLPVGVSAAGLVSSSGEVLVGSYIRWDRFPLRAALASRLGVPVRVANDGTASAWGEHVARHRPPGPLLFVTVGTGLGGGLVSNGVLYEGAHGLATEIGHLMLDPLGPRCQCGNLGCLEALASGTGIADAFRRAGGGSAVEGARGVVAAARAGDELARRTLEDAGTWLGLGIAQLCSVLDPGLVVIGGGLGLASHELVEAAGRRFGSALRFAGTGTAVEIEPSILGRDAALYGAAHLAPSDAPSATMDPAALRRPPGCTAAPR